MLQTCCDLSYKSQTLPTNHKYVLPKSHIRTYTSQVRTTTHKYVLLLQVTYTYYRAYVECFVMRVVMNIDITTLAYYSAHTMIVLVCVCVSMCVSVCVCVCVMKKSSLPAIVKLPA